MSVLRFEPFRDPFREVDRLFNTMMSGTRLPQGTMSPAGSHADTIPPSSGRAGRGPGLSTFCVATPKPLPCAEAEAHAQVIGPACVLSGHAS